MNVCVVGCDENLRAHCRYVLSEMGNEPEVIVSEQGIPRSEADLYIWEYDPRAMSEFPRYEIVNRTLFVVDPKDIEDLRRFVGGCRASILLKPATAAALRPFLEHAMRRENRIGPAHNPDHKSQESDSLFECLLNANLRLQEYEQGRINFLARVSHDFRAPLTALAGYCGLLIDQRVGDLHSNQIDLLSRMHRSIRRLSRLADGLFALSTGQRVTNEPSLCEGDLHETVQQVLFEIGPYADSKKISIEVDFLPPTEPFFFDEGKIEQLLINLLENSCKFTSKGGKIDLYGYPVHWSEATPRNSFPDSSVFVSRNGFEPNAYRIDICDSGCGIAPEYLESIFDEYTSYSASSDRAGGGLGLAISRQIVKAHGGNIWAESSPKGARFSVVLPYRSSSVPFRTGSTEDLPQLPLEAQTA